MGKFLKNREVFKGDVVKKINEYVPIADYDQFEINDMERKQLIECEKNILFHQQKTKEHLMAISETLFKAQEVLANHHGGTFRTWFEELGMKKDFVYMCLKRYRLYIDYENDKVMELPERIVKEITREGQELEFSEDDILKIIEADKPAEILKEIKFELSGNPTTQIRINVADICGIGDEIIEVIPSLDEVLKEKRYKLKQVSSEIKDLEKTLKTLKKEKESLENEISHLDSEKLFYEK